jgi:hypothetical protein
VNKRSSAGVVFDTRAGWAQRAGLEGLPVPSAPPATTAATGGWDTPPCTDWAAWRPASAKSGTVFQKVGTAKLSTKPRFSVPLVCR